MTTRVRVINDGPADVKVGTSVVVKPGGISPDVYVWSKDGAVTISEVEKEKSPVPSPEYLERELDDEIPF